MGKTDGRMTMEKKLRSGCSFCVCGGTGWRGGGEVLSLSFTRLSLDLSALRLHITISRMSVGWRKREGGEAGQMENERERIVQV